MAKIIDTDGLLQFRKKCDERYKKAGQEQSVSIPVASPTVLGGVKPVAKTAEMTQSVGIDANGALFTKPAPESGGGGGGLKGYYVSNNMENKGGTVSEANFYCINDIGQFDTVTINFYDSYYAENAVFCVFTDASSSRTKFRFTLLSLSDGEIITVDDAELQTTTVKTGKVYLLLSDFQYAI